MESKEPLPAFVFPHQPISSTSNPMVVFLCDDSDLAWDCAISVEKICSSRNFPVVATCLKEYGDDENYSTHLKSMVENDNLIGAVIVFDRSKRESYLRIPFWHNTLLEVYPPARIAILAIEPPSHQHLYDVDAEDLLALSKETYHRYVLTQVESSQDEKIFDAVFSMVSYLI